MKNHPNRFPSSQTKAFWRDVLHGLRKPLKELPCKYFYDIRGAELFERICELDEYYLTRCELAVLEGYAREMAGRIGPGCVLIEYGSGSGRKTLLLLDHLDRPAAYVPVDINADNLATFARQLAARYPRLQVAPVCADFTKPFDVPELRRPSARRVVYFSGSTIGNFSPTEAVPLLKNIARLCGPGGGLLIAADLQKDRRILKAAYDDREGMTAAFNLNLLVRINRELGADIALDRFRHRAFYNEIEGRIEMHLVSQADQAVRIGGELIAFKEGETIHTENSYKYTLPGFAALARQAGLEVEQVWTDERGYFSVQYGVVRNETR
jgi:dimethylhistidine N-methyltransferase